MARNEVIKVFDVDVASSTTLSSAIDLRQGWEKVSLLIPSFSSASDIFVQGATTSNGTYVRVTNQPTAAGDVTDFRITSGLSSRIIPIPSEYQHLKIELSTAQTDTTSVFNVICKS